MKNLAPQIVRQRLLIEGYYERDVDGNVIDQYFKELTKALDLRVYGEPIIHSPSGEGAEENQGFDAFIPLIDSGISLYVWTKSKFLAVVLFTCKSFDEEKALQKTKDFFNLGEYEQKGF